MPAINTAAELFNVRGLVAVITGGGSGLGMYAARALDANGAAAVYIIGRRAEPLQAVAASAQNGTIKPLVGDVTDKASLARLAAQIESEQGHINLLFANAGVIGPRLGDSLATRPAGAAPPTVEEYAAALLAPDMAEFTATYHTNVAATAYTIASFLALLKAGNAAGNVAQDSQVLVTSSVAGFSRAVAAGYAYSASKAGVTHLVKMLATTFARNGYRIRANVVAPGFYPSEITGPQFGGLEAWRAPPGRGHEGVFEGAKDMSMEEGPAGRTGSEQDFAGAFLFLASQAGAFVNGETLVTDGGRLCVLPGVY